MSSDPGAELTVRLSFFAPIARGSVVELTFFGRPGLFGEVVYEAEPLVVDRATGIVFLSDRFAAPGGEATADSIASAFGLRAVKTLVGTVVRAVVVSPVVSNAPLSTELRLTPVD